MQYNISFKESEKPIVDKIEELRNVNGFKISSSAVIKRLIGIGIENFELFKEK